MKNASIPTGIVGLLLAFLFPAFSASETTRIAIIAEGEAEAFGDVLGAELGMDASIRLVERADLDRLSAEATVQDLSPTDRPFALARLTQAQGLLFVSIDKTEEESPLLVIRLSGTVDGTVINGLVLPWLPTDLETIAILAATRLKASLRQIPGPGDAAPLAISLLGLRVIVDSPESRSLETRFNLMLAHRLALDPGLRLLERWRMDDLVFERALHPLGQLPLAGGAKLVDGSIEKRLNGTVRVNLRIRNQERDNGITHAFEGSEARLSDFVEQIVRALSQNSTTRSSPNESLGEANSYAELGRFLITHGLAPQAAQAFEAAIALGDDTAATLRSRVEAYAMCAYPLRLGTFLVSTGGGSGLEILSRETAEFKVAAATRSVTYSLDLLLNPRLQTTADEQKQTAAFGAGALNASSRVLFALHEAQLPYRYEPAVSRLRFELARLVTKLDQSILGRESLYLLSKVQAAPCWCASPEETIEYYRVAFSCDDSGQSAAGESIDRATTLRDQFVYFPSSKHGPFLDDDPPAHEVGLPRLLNWESNDHSKVLELWKDFIKELQESPDLQDQADGFLFEFASFSQADNRAAVLDKAIEFLWKNRERLVEKEAPAIFASLDLDINVLNQGADPGSARARLIDFVLYSLNEGQWVPPLCVSWIATLIDKGRKWVPTPEESLKLTAALDRYEERAKAFPDWEEPQSLGLGRMRGRKIELMTARNHLLAAVPETKLPQGIQASTDSLRVSRLWNLHRHLRYPVGYGRIDPESLTCARGRIWFHLRGAGDGKSIPIVSFDPSTLESTVYSIGSSPDPTFVMQILPEEDSLWVVKGFQTWHFDIVNHQSSLLDLPQRTFLLQSVSGQMIAAAPPIRSTLSSKNLSAIGAAVAQVTTKDSSWIVSSRRRPPEHPLDLLDVRNVFGVFPGAGGVPWIVVSTEDRRTLIYSLDRADAREPKFDFTGSWPIVKSDGNRTLIYCGNARGRDFKVVQAWLFDPRSPSPRLLLKDPEFPGIDADLNACWQVPEVLRPTPGFCHFPTFFGEELWVLKGRSPKLESESTELVGFLPDTADPVVIPLHLEFSPEDAAHFLEKGLQPDRVRSPRPRVQRDGLMATPYGLVFGCELEAVIWILPWEEIRKWIKTHPRGGQR